MVAEVTNERANCNKLGTYYKFEQYQQQEMKSNSIFLGKLLLKAQKKQDMLTFGGPWALWTTPWLRICPGVRYPSRLPSLLDCYSTRHSRSLMFLQL